MVAAKSDQGVLHILSGLIGGPPQAVPEIGPRYYDFDWRGAPGMVWFSGRGAKTVARFTFWVADQLPALPQLYRWVATHANDALFGSFVAHEQADGSVLVRIGHRLSAAGLGKEHLARVLDEMAGAADNARHDLADLLTGDPPTGPAGSSDDWGTGYRDLLLTFGEAGLAVPPIPKALRPRLRWLGPWCWSTRDDINPFEMYMFGRYTQEALSGKVDDYAAVSHAGHGFNSYGLNYHLVSGAVGLFVQHGWGGAYSNPIDDHADIARTYECLRLLLDDLRNDLPASLTHVLRLSDFRLIASYDDLRRTPPTAPGGPSLEDDDPFASETEGQVFARLAEAVTQGGGGWGGMPWLRQLDDRGN